MRAAGGACPPRALDHDCSALTPVLVPRQVQAVHCIAYFRRSNGQLEPMQGSTAYAKALVKAEILTQDEADAITSGLAQVGQEWDAGTFEVKPGDEDIHTANERRLTEIVGTVGGKLHTGRCALFAG